MENVDFHTKTRRRARKIFPTRGVRRKNGPKQEAPVKMARNWMMASSINIPIARRLHRGLTLIARRSEILAERNGRNVYSRTEAPDAAPFAVELQPSPANSRPICKLRCARIQRAGRAEPNTVAKLTIAKFDEKIFRTCWERKLLSTSVVY